MQAEDLMSSVLWFVIGAVVAVIVMQPQLAGELISTVGSYVSEFKGVDVDDFRAVQ